MATFTLDVSTLSGDSLSYVETAFQEKGYGIVLEWVQAGADRDIRIVGHAIRSVPSEMMDTETPMNQIVSGLAYGMGDYGSGVYSGTGTGFFILDVSKLTGDSTILRVHTALQERGRSMQLEWTQAGSNQDMKIIGHAVRAVPADTHALDTA